MFGIIQKNIKDDNTVFCGDLNCKGRCKDTSSLYNGEINTKLYVESWGSRMLAPYAASLFYIGDKGGDFGQGKWWLPSMGEMMMIYANMRKVNYALSLIEGATQLAENWYWTSTEYSATFAWGLYLGNGYATYLTKAADQGRVRAISAFILTVSS